MQLPLRGPSARDLLDRFDDARQWISELSSLPHVRVEMRVSNHRVLGTNQVPDGVWIDTLDDALRLLGKQRDAQSFRQMRALTLARVPEVVPWLERRPLKALELSDDWPRLLEVVAWIQRRPGSGLYLRQVDLPGVHTKFIEAHRGVLTELLELLLPELGPETGFERRYGFLERPPRIRFRILDPARSLLSGSGVQDVTLDDVTFAALDLRIEKAFVTENEVNFLALPPMPEAMVIFGAGYGFEAWRKATWLGHCRVFYWGDIDTHGFAILDQFRSQFPSARSVLMDRATLQAFSTLWTIEANPRKAALGRLDPEEQALYEDLRDDRLGSQVRLEQERIGFDWVVRTLQAL
jgi:hypothetical protein